MALLCIKPFRPEFVIYQQRGLVSWVYILKQERHNQMVVVQGPTHMGRPQGTLEYWTHNSPGRQDRWLLIGPPRKEWL